MQHNDTRARRADRLRAALDYGARGVPVYPLVPGEKNPVIRRCPEAKRLKLTGAALAEHARTCPRDGHGFHDATTDPSRITAWFNRWPLANIGTPTGERSGILALDVDPDKGGDASLDALEAEDGKLPATRTHASGSGGTHYLLRYPEGSGIRNSAGKLASGLDIRGEGGYIV